MSTKAQQRRTRLNALLSSKAKKRLLRLSKDADTSMSAFLNDLILRIGPGDDKEATKHEDPEAWIERNLGVLKDKVKPEDWERDDRIGDMLRKYAPR